MINLTDKIQDQNTYHWQEFSFNHQQQIQDKITLRNRFISRVYSIIALQLLVTIGFILLNMFNPTFYQFQTTNPMFFWVALATSIGSLIALSCCEGFSTQCPTNVILLGVFTLAESYMASNICSYYYADTILNAAIATLGSTIGLTLYALKTKSDFSDSYSKFYGILWSFFFISLFLMIMNLWFVRCEGLSLLLAVAFSILFGFYIIIDTQLIMGGRKKEMKLDQYILGAAMLYIDIVRLFLNLLRIMG